jgi:hypothetical protein
MRDNECKGVLAGKPEENRQLRIPNCRLEKNIKIRS